jgi:hypothetical protein
LGLPTWIMKPQWHPVALDRCRGEASTLSIRNKVAVISQVECSASLR